MEGKVVMVNRKRIPVPELKPWLCLAVLAGILAGGLPAQNTAGGLAASAAASAVDLADIPGGAFTMGSYDRYENEQPAHTVILSPFRMARTETTQLQYQAIMGRNPSAFRQGSLAMLHPVENVCWYDAILFCNLASQQEGLDPVYFADASFATVWAGQSKDVFWKPGATGYRLPTEAEWEYAARAGSRADVLYPEGGKPIDQAWFSENSGSQDENGLDADFVSANRGWTHLAGRKAANAYGLYDMLGNVREWCWDWLGRYVNKTATDPAGPLYGPGRILRGGGYASDAEDITVSARSQSLPGVRSPIFGFRVCRSK
jgi:formylglycine-generating enzyme required for sulfatase activity